MPLLVVVLTAVTGVYMLVGSQAATKHKPRYWTRAERAHFASATLDYWSNPKRQEQAANAKAHIYDIDQVPCKPSMVRISYYNDPKDDAIAYVNSSVIPGKGKVPAAVRIHTPANASSAVKAAIKQHNTSFYCKMHFNLAFQYQIMSPGYACVIFMHEYGHMLGREHNTNIFSPMYTGYVKNLKGYGGESFSLNKERVRENSKC